LDNQTNFLKQLTGLTQKYNQNISDVVSQNTDELSNRMTVNKVDNDDAAKETFLVNIPENSKVYLNLTNLTF
ncbi:hypothetical protein ACJBT6_10640, partial [Streptococcus suis]